jgi:hypothetical protein
MHGQVGLVNGLFKQLTYADRLWVNDDRVNWGLHKDCAPFCGSGAQGLSPEAGRLPGQDQLTIFLDEM